MYWTKHNLFKIGWRVLDFDEKIYRETRLSVLPTDSVITRSLLKWVPLQRPCVNVCKSGEIFGWSISIKNKHSFTVPHQRSKRNWRHWTHQTSSVLYNTVSYIHDPKNEDRELDRLEVWRSLEKDIIFLLWLAGSTAADRLVSTSGGKSRRQRPNGRQVIIIRSGNWIMLIIISLLLWNNNNHTNSRLIFS